MKVDVIQNSAISFSVCIENNYNNLNKLVLHLKAKFKVICNTNVDLYTIRHYNKSALAKTRIINDTDDATNHHIHFTCSYCFSKGKSVHSAST